MNRPKILVVTKNYKTTGSLAIEGYCNTHNIDCEIRLAEDDATPSAINNNKAVIFRISPVTYDYYQTKIMPKLSHEMQLQLGRTLDAFDKTVSSQILELAGVPTPKTYISTVESPILLTTPYVIKAAIGNQGSAVYLAEDINDVARFRLQATQDNNKCVEQEYISESKGVDKRLFVVGDRVVAAMQRNSKGDDFRANTHLGGIGKPYTPTITERKMALDALNAHKLMYAGIDIIDSHKGPLVLEVNPSPGFAIATITGIDVVKHVIDIYKETI